MRASDFAFLDWPGPIPFAHRGAHDDEATGENTMAAFQRAVDLGFRYVETDVHATADGVLLAFHDDALDRVTDRTGVIAELPADEVARARVNGEPIPLLEDLLLTFPDLRVNIDPKHDRSVGPLIEVLRRTRATDRVCVGSFSDERLAIVRDALPGICTSLGPRETLDLGLAAVGAQEAAAMPAPCAQVPPRHGDTEIVTAEVLAEAHRRGMHVHVWTIDERAEMERLLDLGVDGLMTDAPLALRDVLAQRGLWFG